MNARCVGPARGTSQSEYGNTRVKRIDPERIEEILRAAGCPSEQQLLGDLGEDGWELIGVVPQSIPDTHKMYLKKAVA